MAEVTYSVIDQLPGNIPDVEKYSSKDSLLINGFPVNKAFNTNKHYIEFHFYSTKNRRLASLYEYPLQLEDVILTNNDNEESDEGISQLGLDPAKLAAVFGYTTSEVKILFHFLNDSFTYDNKKQSFYIDSISDDRTELLIYSEDLSLSRMTTVVEKLSSKLKDESYFDELWLNFGNNDLFITTNIGLFELDDKDVIKVKLYEPLPDEYTVKNTLQVVEKISDSIAVKVTPEYIPPEKKAPTLAGPNFSVEVDEPVGDPTSFFNFNQLFGFENTNRNRELFSYIKEKGVDIGLDYSSYNNFINLSSASERLKNFKYKIGLLETYQSDLDSENAVSSSTGNTVNASSSIAATENLINGIIENFDHYERFLYYESGSHSWPKSNNEKPHINLHTTSSEAITWYSEKLTSASNHDTSNYDMLTNFLPDYVSEDSRNASAITFAHMMGQHYDNLWIYSKAITDRYNTDHRVDQGLSKDLVKEAIKGMGVKLYNSIEGSNDLFRYLVSDTYDSGSIAETITTFRTMNPNLQPMSRRDYEGELYKRIYHNLPLLLKSKGTERGIKALINCFGVPSDILFIRYHGDIQPHSGAQTASNRTGGGPYQETTGSINRIELNSFSEVADIGVTDLSGSVFSQYTSVDVSKETSDKSENVPVIEIGFSLGREINKTLLNSIKTGDLEGIGVDDFLGDPTNLHLPYYGSFNALELGTDITSMIQAATEGLGHNSTPNLKDFVRILKFYDGVMFKMVRDMVPESTHLSTGIIIEPHILNRSKAKSPSLSGTNDTYSGSIDTVFMTGSSGGAYNRKDNNIFLDREHSELPAPWHGQIGGASDLVLSFNDEGWRGKNSSFEVGEISAIGTLYYHPDNTKHALPVSGTHWNENTFSVFTPFEVGNTHTDFFLMFSKEATKTRFPARNSSAVENQHIVPIMYSASMGEWVVRANSNANTDDYPLTGSQRRTSDVIIAAVHQSGSGIALPYHNFYTQLNGNRVYTTGSYTLQNRRGVSNFTIGLAGSGYAEGDKDLIFDTEYVSGGSNTGTNLKFKIAYLNSGQVTGLEIVDSGHDYTNGASYNLVNSSAAGSGCRVVVISSLDKKGVIQGPGGLITMYTTEEEKHFNPPTFYEEIVKTKSGSVGKIIGDESPTITGELSGSKILVSDGELNDENTFKIDNPSDIIYDVEAVPQTGADIINELTIFNNAAEANSAAAACAFNNTTPVQKFHDGDNLSGIVNDRVFQDQFGVTAFDGNDKFFKVNFSADEQNDQEYAVKIDNTTGTIESITPCSQFDTVNPSTPRITWKEAQINLSNVNSVPIEIHNIGDDTGTVTIHYTASSAGGGTPIKANFTVSNTATQSISLNTSGLNDGNVTLQVTASDVANDVIGTASLVDTTNNMFGTIINKNLTAPSGFSSYFAHITGINSFTTASIIASRLSVGTSLTTVTNVPSGFTGSVTVTLTGNSNTISKTQNHPQAAIFGGGTDEHVTSFNHGQNNVTSIYTRTGTFTNTIYGTVNLTDSAGNAGTAVNVQGGTYGYIIHRDIYYTWENEFGSAWSGELFSFGGSDSSIARLNVRNVTNFNSSLSYGLSDNWVTSLSIFSSGTLRNVGLSWTQNQTGATRTAAITGSVTIDGREYALTSQGLSQEDYCVDPQTQILTPTGTIQASEIKVGDVIRTKHEHTLEWMQDIIIQVRKLQAYKKLLITFENGDEYIASSQHRIFKDGEFIAISKLKVGDELGDLTIAAIDDLGEGEVIEINSEKSNTYMSVTTGMILNHNSK